MLSTLLVIGGVLAGLLVLLALIVRLSARAADRRPPGPRHRARGLVGRRRRPSAPRRVVADDDHRHQRDPGGPLIP